MNLKDFLKAFKLNEDNLSMFLGGLVIIVVGVLVFNYFKDKQGTTLPAMMSENEIGGAHEVVKGETLWSIAEENYGSGYNWVDIKSENKLTSDLIEVGQQLSIPDVAAKKPTVSKPTLVQSDQTAISGDTYTVVKGDSLWKIAVRAYGDGYRWVEIAKANNLVNPSLIHSGNVLTLPR